MKFTIKEVLLGVVLAIIVWLLTVFVTGPVRDSLQGLVH